MRIFNEEKTLEYSYESLDLEKGELIEDTLITHYDKVPAIEEQGHFEVIKEYPNGGKDVKWVVDVEKVEGQDEHDVTENIYVYKLFNEVQLEIIDTVKKIAENKLLLSNTDFKTLKYIEGCYTEDEYNIIKKERQNYRKEINILENKLQELKEKLKGE